MRFIVGRRHVLFSVAVHKDGQLQSMSRSFEIQDTCMCVDVHQEEQEREQTTQQKPFKRGESVEKANVSERRSPRASGEQNV